MNAKNAGIQPCTSSPFIVLPSWFVRARGGMSLGPSLRKNFVNMNSADGETLESKIANMKKTIVHQTLFSPLKTEIHRLLK